MWAHPHRRLPLAVVHRMGRMLATQIAALTPFAEELQIDP